MSTISEAYTAAQSAGAFCPLPRLPRVGQASPVLIPNSVDLKRPAGHEKSTTSGMAGDSPDARHGY